MGPTDSVVRKGKGKPVRMTVSTKMYCSIGLSSLPPNSFFQLKPIHPSAPIVRIACLNSGPPPSKCAGLFNSALSAGVIKPSKYS